LAREIFERLSADLSTVLGEIDTAIAARFRETQGRARRREETRRQDEGFRGVIAAAFRWLKRSPTV
jgi:hypothetical protein